MISLIRSHDEAIAAAVVKLHASFKASADKFNEALEEMAVARATFLGEVDTLSVAMPNMLHTRTEKIVAMLTGEETPE